jgi:hypothetical protein
MYVKDFNAEFEAQTVYYDKVEYGAVLLIKYAKMRRRELITLKEYVDIRNAIEEQLFQI